MELWNDLSKQPDSRAEAARADSACADFGGRDAAGARVARGDIRDDVASDARHVVGRLHRFLLDVRFYPLVLCTLVCFAFLAARAHLLGHFGYGFLVKNLFLAWTPYCFSLIATILHERGERRAALPRSTQRRAGATWLAATVWAAWLAMLPNAPYIFTDLIHWRARREMPWWFDLGLVLMFALAGCFLGIASLRIMHDLVRRRLGPALGWAFVCTVAILSGFGIDLGRFERWNSWDLLTRPHHILGQIGRGLADPLAHGRTLGVTLMFGAMMLMTYVMFTHPARRVR